MHNIGRGYVVDPFTAALTGHTGINSCIFWTDVYTAIKEQVTVCVPQSTDGSV